MKPSVRTYLKVVMNLGIAVVSIILLLVFLPKVILFFMPFVVAWVIALIANPIVRFFEEKLKIKRKAGTAFVIISVIALVILAGYVIGAKIAEESINLINDLPEIWDDVENDFKRNSDNLSIFYDRLPMEARTTIESIGEEMDGYVGELVSRASTPTIEALGNFARHLPTAIVGIVMCLLSAYFFVAEREYLSTGMKKHMPEAVRYRYYMMTRSFKRAVGGYFKAQFKIEIWMYILLVIGLGILKVDYVLLIALGIALLDFLPIFGTGTVLMPWAVIKALGGDYQMAVGLLIIWCVGQLARQIIQPKIVGDSMGVAPIPTLFLLFIGYKAGGVLGMIIAVPIGIIIVNMYEEGVFDTTLNSFKILMAGINNFRRLEEKDLEGVRRYEEAQKEYRKKQKEKE
ncbi:sporulation integral membrane protein YtvI [Kineothrix sp. MB12-C1]|uniref:sporulation integral membrane protein YtvI n=1 Tax=Kineothrix sp. MB12-C1 TaxID=3070215 RepID=UPI0027D235D9|nr:sporulation integral membrane protein YtvI [Kineothrix sp. MB12-C1]WMC93598.1 sporulation integral membrane protein YtvI [Kineothrix sp. MB12-C1]